MDAAGRACLGKVEHAGEDPANQDSALVVLRFSCPGPLTVYDATKLLAAQGPRGRELVTVTGGDNPGEIMLDGESPPLDLTKPLSQDEVKQVTDAMDTWGVTVWRNTRMSDEQHVEFSRNFGFLERVPRREGARFRLPFRELFDASNLNVEGEITQDEAAIQYRKGDRQHALMTPQAAALSDQDIADLAAYFGSRPTQLRDLHGVH